MDAADGHRATWQLSEGELAASQKQMSTVYARQLGLVAEAEQRGLAKAIGYRSTEQMLVGVLRVSKGEAPARLTQATLDIARTRAALAAGGINPEHSYLIGKVLAKTPSWVPDEQRGVDEELLLSVARQGAPAAVGKVCDRLEAWWDADGREPEGRENDLAGPRREFRYRWTTDRRFEFSGETDEEAGSWSKTCS